VLGEGGWGSEANGHDSKKGVDFFIHFCSMASILANKIKKVKIED